MINYTLSPSSKTALSLALQRYENVKLEIERQRENELRLENERREREKRERELRAQQSREAFKRGFMSLAKVVLPIAICYGLYVYSHNLNVRNVQAFVENTLIFVSLTAFFANVHLSNNTGFTGTYYSGKGSIFNSLAGLLFWISIPVLFIGGIVALIFLLGAIVALPDIMRDGLSRTLGDPYFWLIVGIILTPLAAMVWIGLCLEKQSSKCELHIDGGGATADWVSLVSTAVLMLYAYSPIYFAIAD